MQRLMGFTLSVLRDEQTGEDARSSTTKIVEQWIEDWYRRRGIPLPAVSGGEGAGPTTGHGLSRSRFDDRDVASLIEYSWQYPADDDPSALWAIGASIAGDEQSVDLTLSVSLASMDTVLRPFRYRLYVPRLIRMLANTGRALSGSRTIASTPRTVSVGMVDAFVAHDLLAGDRRLPIVLVARSAAEDRFMVNPTELATSLCGLAETWVLNDKWSAYELSDLLGRDLGCFDGGVRTYWPGFSAESRPLDHPLLTRLAILQRGLNDDGIQALLLRVLGPLSAMRLADSERTRVLRARAREAQRANQRDAIAATIRAGDLQKLEKDFAAQIEENYDLRDDRDNWKKRATDAEAMAKQLQENFSLMQTSTPEPEIASTSTTGESLPAEVQTVLAAVEWASTELPILKFWPSARESASESLFGQPEKVRRAFEALADIGQMYQLQAKTGQPIGNLEELFELRGFKYAPSDSQTTLTKYRRERTFLVDGDRRLFERHLTIGGGDRVNCLQIYFEFREDRSKIDVAYCGMHLPYEGMRS